MHDYLKMKYNPAEVVAFDLSESHNGKVNLI